MTLQTSNLPKHVQVFEFLLSAIDRGDYRIGDRLPVDTELARVFGASRPTVAKALSELQSRGLVERRVGSGTYVRKTNTDRARTELLGILVPDTGSTEILDAIVRQITREAQRFGHGLLLGGLGDFSDHRLSADEKGRIAEEACNRLVEQGASGVFVAPVEFMSDGGCANRKVMDRLRQARIPAVLVDRDIAYSNRSPNDLVAMDHMRAGFLLARHLIELGHKRIAFLARENSSGSSLLRRAGAREAIALAGGDLPATSTRSGSPENKDFIREFLDEVQPEAMICANDETAAHLMLTLDALGLRVPDDLAVVGVDNVNYGEFLRVPLTTIAQPCEEIGKLAVQTLLSRIQHPESAMRTVLLEPVLVVRRSCGAGKRSSTQTETV